MSILLDASTRVIVQGITGREGSFHAGQMIEMGTNVPGDTAFYPDDDLFILWGENGMAYAHKDGRKY